MLELWSMWTQSLASTLTYFSQQLGLTEAIAIIVLTLLARAVLMPISLTAAYRMEVNKQKMNALKPALERIKEQFRDRPQELMAQTMQLHREQGIRFFDRWMLSNIVSQTTFGLGIFQALSKAGFASKFLWIPSLAKPDLFLTIAIGILMYFGMTLVPNSGAEMSAMMIVIPVLIAVVTVAFMPSAIGLYWATSNVATIGQSLALRWLVARDIRHSLDRPKK